MCTKVKYFHFFHRKYDVVVETLVLHEQKNVKNLATSQGKHIPSYLNILHIFKPKVSKFLIFKRINYTCLIRFLPNAFTDINTKVYVAKVFVLKFILKYTEMWGPR